jgi:hypothetical protein
MAMAAEGISSAVFRAHSPPSILGRHFGVGVLPRCSRHVLVGLTPTSVKAKAPPDDADAPDNDAPNAKKALDKDACAHACMSTAGSARAGCDQ